MTKADDFSNGVTVSKSQVNPSAEALSASTQVGEIAHLPLWHGFKPEDIVPGMHALMDEVEKEFMALELAAIPEWEGLMIPLERLEHKLNKPLARLEHLKNVCYSQVLSEAIDAIQPGFVKLNTQMGQSKKIFHALSQLNAASHLSGAQKKAVENRLKSMKHDGVNLAGPEQLRFIEINQALEKLSTEFTNNLVEQVKIDRVKATSASSVKGIPADLLDAAARQANKDGFLDASKEVGPWHFNVDATNFITVMERCECAELREKFYLSYRALGQAAGKDNRPLLEKILKLKQEKAILMGFDNAAQASLDVKMAPNVAAVDELIDRLSAAAVSAAEEEMQTLIEFAKQRDSQLQALKPWDVAYWNERYKQENFNIDQENVRQFFQVPSVMESLFSLMSTLFGIEIRTLPVSGPTEQAQSQQGLSMNCIPTWHEDVKFYEVKEQGEVIAGFFMDPYARPGEKISGAWMDTVVDRSTALAYGDRESSIPVALFVLNARPPMQGKPGLFSLDEIETLFHEFGHALQHMLTRITEGAVSGINGVEWDAVEVASQFNENWMYRPEYLKSVSCHVDTGEQLDDVTIEKIIGSRNYWAGNAMLRQLFLARTDMRLHQEVGVSEQAPQLSPYEIEKQVRTQLIKTPYLPSESQLPSFSHIFAGGYSAGYYSYKWAEVIAADAFAAFEEVGLDDLKALAPVAARYRETILAQGGARPAAEIYHDFRGREASPEALLRQRGLIS